MMKTAYDILEKLDSYATSFEIEYGLPMFGECIKDMSSIVDQAIQERAVEFAEWLNGNCESTALGYYHQDHLYSTSDLYKLFTKQNQK